jgi:methionine synthase II (cobalamin-independent)
MLRTTIAGSLPKPAWLARPEMLWAPWALPPDTLASGQRDAVLIALKEQEAAGIDVVTDGEQSRQHFVHGFLERLDGIDFGKRVTIGIRADRYKAEVPTVTGPIARRRPIHLDEVRWARAHTDRRLKFTIPGPMTIVDTLADEHYRDRRQLAMEFARVINEEARDLVMAGLDVLQLDEPAFNVYMDDVAGWGIAALHRAIEGLACTTAVHICYGYGIKANIDWKQTLGANGVSTSRRSRCWRRAASIRSPWSARTRRCRCRCWGCWPARTCWSAASTWRARRSRRRRRWPSPFVGRSSTCHPSGSTRARTAEWSRCPVTSRQLHAWRRSRGRGARRRMKRPTFVGARRTLDVQGVRLARGSPAPPRIWTFLISLPGCRSL